MIKLYITAANKASEHETGAALAKYALFDTTGIRAELSRDARGKPYFENTGAYISISHSSGMCLAAISDSEIGADIEKISRSDDRLTKLARRYFTEDEYEYVKADPCLRFYEIWCAKESYIKYTGEGFSKPMSSFSVKALPLCFSTAVFNGYMIAVCSELVCDIQPRLVELQ